MNPGQGSGSVGELLPEIRRVRAQLAAVITDLEDFDARLTAAAEQAHHMTHAAPSPDPGLPVEAATLTGAVTDLNAQVGALTNRITRSERVNAALITLLALIVLVGGYAVYVGYQVRAQTTCQGQQNDGFRAATLVSRRARDQQDNQQLALIDQQLGLFTTILNPNATTTAQRAAIVDYTKSVAASKQAIIDGQKKRADNPLPAGNCS